MTIEIFIILMVIFGIGFVLLISAALRPISLNKMMQKQIKTMKNVLDENEEDLREISSKSAEINSSGVEITARAIKKGFTETEKNDTIFCKHCGKEIEEDSKFCRYCGKEQ